LSNVDYEFLKFEANCRICQALFGAPEEPRTVSATSGFRYRDLWGKDKRDQLRSLFPGVPSRMLQGAR
jgi:hypothetical protein